MHANLNATRGAPEEAPLDQNWLLEVPDWFYCVERDEVSTNRHRAVTGWYPPGGPSCRLAASHLQGPKTFITQLDHLLSLVPEMVSADAAKVRHGF